MYMPDPVKDTAVFRSYLLQHERSQATISQYTRCAKILLEFTKGEQIDKEKMIAFKEYLWQTYKPSSCNAIIAGINQFMECLGFRDLKLRMFKTQGTMLRQQERYLTQAEFDRLIAAAKALKKERLVMAMETIAMTGARISELRFFTVESVKSGQIQVRNKGKIRTILLPKNLKKRLMIFAAGQGILKGCIFITSSGKPVDRSNFWREMQNLREKAHVRKEKIFPHNLRHLFAQTYFRVTKDLAGLGDILGHSSLNVTRIYTMKTLEMQRKALDKMSLEFIKKAGLKPA